MAVGVLMDIARPRLSRTLVRIGADGRDWDDPDQYGGGTYIDPVTQTVMLMPTPLSPNWDTTATGLYARLARADYRTAGGATLPSSEWKENQLRLAGDIYLESQGVNYAVYTNTTYPVNQPMFVSWFILAGQAPRAVALECGWGVPGAATCVSLRFYAGGDCEVWKGSVRLAIYSATSAGGNFRAPKPGSKTPTGGGSTTKTVDILLIPCRRRELLVITGSQSGFSHVFDDLNADSATNTITASGHFWWRVAGAKASVQCAPVKFPASGYVLRKPVSLRVAPPSGASFGVVSGYDTPGYSSVTVTESLVKANGSAYTPDGTTTNVRIKVALGCAANDATPFLYSTDFTLAPAVTNTNATQQTDVASFVQRLTFSVGEEASDVKGSMVLRSDTSITAPGSQSNRPLRITDGGKPVITGTTREPRWQERQTDVAGVPALIDIPLRDLWAQLEAAKFEEDGPPLDGLLLTGVIAALLEWGGIPSSEHDIESSTFALPFSPATASGEWSYQPRAGDSCAKWLSDLHRDFASTWFMGFYPTTTGVKFRFCSEAGLGTTYVAEAWLHRGGTNSRTAIRKWQEDTLPPEFTRATVYGYDPARRLFLRDTYVNASLENAALAPSARPAGWRGEIAPFVLVEPRFTTADSVGQALDSLVERAGTELRMAEFECDFLLKSNGVPVWRGDVVRIRNKGDYRVLSFSGDMNRNATGFSWRPFRYVAKRIGDIS
jgi:hypothetical protein